MISPFYILYSSNTFTVKSHMINRYTLHNNFLYWQTRQERRSLGVSRTDPRMKFSLTGLLGYTRFRTDLNFDQMTIPRSEVCLHFPNQHVRC